VCVYDVCAHTFSRDVKGKEILEGPCEFTTTLPVVSYHISHSFSNQGEDKQHSIQYL
jgi:hypothetical protein